MWNLEGTQKLGDRRRKHLVVRLLFVLRRGWQTEVLKWFQFQLKRDFCYKVFYIMWVAINIITKLIGSRRLERGHEDVRHY